MNKVKDVLGLMIPIILTAIAVFWFVVYPLLDGKAIKNCQAINEGRRTATKNWVVVKDFVEAAAKRVNEQALAEIRQGKVVQAQADFYAAATYRSFESQINTLPQREIGRASCRERVYHPV